MKAETWRILSRALDTFEEVYSNVSSKLKLQDPDIQQSVNFQKEIVTCRAVLRSPNCSSSPYYSSVPKNKGLKVL